MHVHFEKCDDCCVWMDAGVLSYKRCERNFDCEHCPLDHVLQKEVPLVAAVDEDRYMTVTVPLPGGIGEQAAALIAPYTSAVIHRDFQYSDNQVWVQTLPGGYFRLGLTAYILKLLPTNADIISMATGSEVSYSGPVGWLYADGTTYTMRSPVSGTIVRRNGSIGRINDGIRNSAYDQSWIAVLQGPSDAVADSLVSAAETAAPALKEQMSMFVNTAAVVLSDSEHLGICMNDGGVPVESLEKAFGPRRYWDLVSTVLGMKR